MSYWVHGAGIDTFVLTTLFPVRWNNVHFAFVNFTHLRNRMSVLTGNIREQEGGWGPSIAGNHQDLRTTPAEAMLSPSSSAVLQGTQTGDSKQFNQQPWAIWGISSGLESMQRPSGEQQEPGPGLRTRLGQTSSPLTCQPLFFWCSLGCGQLSGLQVHIFVPHIKRQWWHGDLSLRLCDSYIMVGFNLRGLSQTKWFHDSMTTRAGEKK